MFIIELMFFGFILYLDLLDLFSIFICHLINKFFIHDQDDSWIDDCHILNIMRLAYD